MDEHQEELEQIAKNGCDFVCTHFNGNVVAEKLLSDLIAKQQEWIKSKQ